jgi:hypothetical protein
MGACNWLGRRLERRGREKTIMKNANVSQCANPECERQFKRLGEGKLFVRPTEKNDQGLTQKALWLCEICVEKFDLRYDKRQQEFLLVRRRHAA